jgi:hypothetical protein
MLNSAWAPPRPTTTPITKPTSRAITTRLFSFNSPVIGKDHGNGSPDRPWKEVCGLMRFTTSTPSASAASLAA